MPLTYQEPTTLEEAKAELAKLLAQANGLESRLESAKNQHKEQANQIQAIVAIEQAKFQKSLSNYLKKDDRKEIISAAKSFKMLTEEEAKKLKKTIRVLQKKLDEHKCPINESTSSNNNSEENPQTAVEQLIQLQANSDKLMKQKQALERQLSTLNQQLAELNNNQQESDQLATEMAKLKEKYDNLLATQESLIQTNKQLESDNSNLNQQITKLEQKPAELAKQPKPTNDNQPELDNLKQEIKDLESVLSLQKSSNKDLETELAQNKEELNKWQERFPNQTAHQIKLEREDWEYQRAKWQEEVARMKKEVQIYYREYQKFLDIATQQKGVIDHIRTQLKKEKLESKIEILTIK